MSSPPAIVIDAGSCEFRGGWQGQTNPKFTLRSVGGKTRTKREEETYLAPEGGETDQARFWTKPCFERNVVYHFDAFESVMDIVLSRLGIEDSTLQNPMLMTECIANPNYCRSRVSEVLFECYGTPAVSFGVDQLFSVVHHQQSANDIGTMLLISGGHNASHVLPIVSGQPLFTACRRVNVGGAHMSDYLQRVLRLRYPIHSHIITQTRSQALLEMYGQFATEDITSSLMLMLASPERRLHQLPFTAKDVAVISPEELARREQQRMENVNRLRELARNRRKSLRDAAVLRLRLLTDLNSFLNSAECTAVDTKRRLVAAGLHSHEQVEEELQDAKVKAWKLLSSAAARNEIDSEDVESLYEELKSELSQEKEMPSFPLLQIPDHELTPAQRDEKRKQRLLAGNIAARQRARLRREAEQSAKEQDRMRREQLRQEDPQQWLQEIRERRDVLVSLLEKKRKRIATKASLTSTRRSSAAENRMKAIIKTLSEPTHKGRRVAETGYGDSEEDWQVYRQLQRDDDGDDEESAATGDVEGELAEIDAWICEMDPHHVSYGSSASLEPRPVTAADFLIDVDVPCLRSAEVLMQPSLLGSEQMGLAETLQIVLNAQAPEIRSRLAANIVLGGGCAAMAGFADRVEFEVRQMLPVGTPLLVKSMSEPALAAWRGAAHFATTDEFTQSCFTRQEYEEFGIGFFKPHRFSNLYIPTPACDRAVSPSQ